ncbi:MAG TPA: molecular chaperone DnaJ [Polyangia bacterium]|nr:molecular chaperone DnaJ [Polyangia bacterium]
MAVRRDYYEVLGVARDADGAQLKRVYRELALKFHPDQNPDNPDAEARFKEVSEAYTVLSDPEKRARYDRRGFDGVDGGAFGVDLGAFTDLFDSLFGNVFGKKKAKSPGRDLRYTLELEFEEAALGVKKTIHFPARADCEACGGTGGQGGASGLATCPNCGGRGEIKVQQGFFTLSKKCATCNGEGKIVDEACSVCKGEGTIDKEREFEVAIPPGTEDGSTRRVPGQGEPGKRGGAPGDLHVVVRVKPHPILRREGDVVVCDVPVSVTQAALGAVIQVPTLDGKVEMRVPPGTQSGTLFRLRGKGVGLPAGGRGDAHVRLAVETPVELTSKQRALFEELARTLESAQLPVQTGFAAKLKK